MNDYWNEEGAYEEAVWDLQDLYDRTLEYDLRRLKFADDEENA